MTEQAKAYTVRKDNSISYRGNFYSLPYDTYQGRGTKVLLNVQDNDLVISNLEQQQLRRHELCSGVGQKIINNDHRRDKNKGISELKEQFCSLISSKGKAGQLIDNIRADKPRYLRDQLVILNR